MNYRQLKYIIKLSEVGNFSQVAEKVGISQPALSKIVKNLEDEIGVKLFERNKNSIFVSPAGEYFLREAKEIVYKEEQLLKAIKDFRAGKAGKLNIGISPFRSLYMVSDVLKKTQERFPQICPTLHELGSEDLRKGILEGIFDFAIINLPIDDPSLEAFPLEPDIIVLAVPEKHVHYIKNSFSINTTSGSKVVPNITDVNTISFETCVNLPFVVMGKTQEMRVLFEKLCADAEFHPQVAAEVVGMATARALVYEGIGSALLPLQFVKKDYKEHNVKLFHLDNQIPLRQPAIVTRRGQYVSDAARYAMDILLQK